ncbi:60 kDa lysophospholipase isoform X3 [Globicephala melas]|uniref:60 kDa lysophospholipase isoform X3 n=1 Tax=Globicephala melas TaxID=9731 RepID=UPI00293D5CF8|nr:60 kDa lysophospholipase isoform X3 [Globicephala melas]XP_060151328.1 60 kDa lysophospholipase isoform X3 [Globicephala melas]
MARAAGPERRLLAIYTGGTIGMRSERGVLVPGKGLAAVLRTLPMFHDEGHAQACGLPEDTLVLPPASPACPDQRVMYTVLECQPLFDSSDMTITEWVQIAQTIERHYGQYHGFVVIHGTDTMAFAASVLSFMLENLQKTVILTGAQVPIHALWNDGRENLLGALLLAGQYVIPEVCLFFQNQLFRGNRVTKVDTRRFAAFCSPNLPPLATVGADVTINRELVRKVRGQGRLVVHGSMERDVGLLRLYPGIPAALVRVFLQPPLKGVVMETFGSGNGPTKPDLLQELREAAERGLVIVNCTHCLQGTVTSDYGPGGSRHHLRLRHDIGGGPGQAVVCAWPAGAEPGWQEGGACPSGWGPRPALVGGGAQSGGYVPGSGRGARTGGSPDRLPAPSPGTACPPLEEPQVWLGLRIPKLSQGIPSLLLFRLASDTAVPGPWGWAEATGAWGDPELEGWRVGLAWCGDLPGVRLRPQAWSPREEFQALGSPLPGSGVPGLRGLSGLLGPGPDGAGPGLRAPPPPPAAAGQGPARGDDAARHGRAPALSAGQHAGPRGRPAP